MKTLINLLNVFGLFFAMSPQAQDDWTQKFPGANPSARNFSAMASLGGDQLLLFGAVEDKSISKTTGSAPEIPESYALHQNPFNPATTISFALPEAGEVSLSIYNMNGQLVKQVASGKFASGRHSLVWDATDERGVRVASGVYLYVIKAGSFTAQRKLVLMK